MKLTEEQIQLMRHHIASIISWPAVQEDVLDHLCCVVEEKMETGQTFETAFLAASQELSPRGLSFIQRQTTFLMDARNVSLMKIMLYSLGFISTGLLSLGWLFSVLRWMGGPEMFNSGFFLITIVFIPMLGIDLYAKSNKLLRDKLRLSIGAISSLIVGTSLIFKLLHLQGADVLLVLGVLLWTFGFLPVLFFNMYKRAQASQ